MAKLFVSQPLASGNVGSLGSFFCVRLNSQWPPLWPLQHLETCVAGRVGEPLSWGSGVTPGCESGET